MRSSRLAVCLAALLATAVVSSAQEPSLPNILWISSEDNGPHLGAYGDDYADTPNLDRLAARGMTYLNAWSTAPVCAPARTTIISGLYPTSTGSQHMRSRARLPAGFRFFPQYLRDAGYYATNNAKEDYNLRKPGQVWNDTSPEAHWRNRPPGLPFFAVFNIGVTHESQTRRRPHEAVHDPAAVRVPAYHPDTPEVRQDWAQYYDKLTEMDAIAGERLRELEAAGLLDDTIIVYWGDHGAGLPRNKRQALNAGLHVPLIVVIPPKFRHLAPDGWSEGARTGRLVGFIDFAPTMLSLAGIEPPAHFQGSAFLGAHEAPPSGYLFGFRDRMDERYDMARSVRDERWVYSRNFMPHLPHGQHLHYLFQTPTTQVWHRLWQEGALAPEQAEFWEPKAVEELYDLVNDPDEVRNLASSPEHRQIAARMRGALSGHILQARDLGFLPEAEIHSRAEEVGLAPYEYGHGTSYRLEEIFDAAALASNRDRDSAADLEALLQGLDHPDSAVRAWSTLGYLVRGSRAARAAQPRLRLALEDEAPTVRIRAAEILGLFGDEEDRAASLDVLLAHSRVGDQSAHDVWLALNALDHLDETAASRRDDIGALRTEHESISPRNASYIPRLIEKILADLE